MIFEVFNIDSEEYKQMMKIILDSKLNKPSKGQVHHIIPRCWFKHYNLPVDNSIANTVLLTYENHKKVHELASKCAVEDWMMGKLTWASNIMLTNAPMTGLKHSKETKKKMSESAKKRWADNDYKAKRIKNHPHNSNVAWNKGLTKKTDKRVAGYALTISKNKKGKKNPHLGHSTKGPLNGRYGKPKTKFGIGYKAHYGYLKFENPEQYLEELKFYNKNGHYSWE